MKNIAGFIGFVIIFHTLIVCPRAWGQYGGPVLSQYPIKDQFPYTFSITSAAGFLYGYGEEIVYKYSGKETYLSQLLWNIKPLFYAGGGLDFSRLNPMEKPGFFTALSLKFGFPGTTGIMEDRDWNAPEDILSNYSRSDNYTDGALLFDYFLGLTLPLKSFALLKIQWGFSWMSFHWTGRDGYLRYPKDKWGNYLYDVPLDDSAAKVPVSGPSISYSQDWLLTYPGLSMLIFLPWRLKLDIAFQISPLVFCFARDNHLLSAQEYTDYVSGGLYLEPRGSIIFSPTERFDLSLYVSYRFIKGAHGDSYTRATGSDKDEEYYQLAQDSGAAWYALDSGLSLKIRF
ncbi:MAG: omptin family outer membrane protease [Treponema sp.]|jgi:outer membrane protease|nr:omptin family outer membrane protease [Treponema sp.]